MSSTSVDSADLIPWWKEPTKDQWLAWIGAWLGWTLDAFDFTIFLLLMVPISKDFGVPLTEVAAVFHADIVDEAGRCHRVRLARRSYRTQEAVDDLDRLVLGLQSVGRPRTEFLVAAIVSCRPRDRHETIAATRGRPTDCRPKNQAIEIINGFLRPNTIGEPA